MAVIIFYYMLKIFNLYTRMSYIDGLERERERERERKSYQNLNVCRMKIFEYSFFNFVIFQFSATGLALEVLKKTPLLKVRRKSWSVSIQLNYFAT